MEGYVTFEGGDIERLFNELEALCGKPQKKMLQERAGALGRYFASATIPVADADASANASAVQSFNAGKAVTVGVSIEKGTTNVTGDSKHAKDVGQSAVRRDIRRVYVSPSQVFRDIREKEGLKPARRFYKLLADGKLLEASLFLNQLGMKSRYLEIIPWDEGARHKQRRNRRGRINSGNRPAIVTMGKKLADYMKEVMRRVGWAKSGFITAARQIPGAKGFSGLPVWMRLPAPGVGIDHTDDPDNRYIILENRVPFVADLVEESTINRAQAAFEASMLKELQIVTDNIKNQHKGTVAA